eukprot:COSAG06_NODE_10229_length_1723_cov_1.185345_2_plen_59_part_00
MKLVRAVSCGGMIWPDCRRKQLEAIEDPEERLALYNRLVDASYERAMAVYAGASIAKV